MCALEREARVVYILSAAITCLKALSAPCTASATRRSNGVILRALPRHASNTGGNPATSSACAASRRRTEHLCGRAERTDRGAAERPLRAAAPAQRFMASPLAWSAAIDPQLRVRPVALAVGLSAKKR